MERAYRHSKHLSPREKSYRLLLPLLTASVMLGFTAIACGGNGGNDKLNCQDGYPPFRNTGKCPSTPAFNDTAPVFYI